MKRKVFFLSAAIAALVLVLLLVTVILLLGYRFRSVDTDRYGTIYYYGKSESGIVYTPEGKITYYAKKNKLVYENGDVYIGEIKDYLPNGQGVYQTAAGEVIEGGFVDGVANGACSMTLASGNTYRGNFVNGEWDGDGTLTLIFDDASEVPQAVFHNSRLDGQVTYSYRNGASYVGGYSNGLPHGSGRLTYANGDVYEGEFSNGDLAGVGKYTFADGSVYQGEFENSLPNGSGTYTYYKLNGASVTVSGAFVNGVRLIDTEE